MRLNKTLNKTTLQQYNFVIDNKELYKYLYYEMSHYLTLFKASLPKIICESKINGF